MHNSLFCVIFFNSNFLIIFPGSSLFQYIVVEEGINVRLHCVANGQPTPIIQWHRSDGVPIKVGNWEGKKIIRYDSKF